jgi:hypothetical protein
MASELLDPALVMAQAGIYFVVAHSQLHLTYFPMLMHCIHTTLSVIINHKT